MKVLHLIDHLGLGGAQNQLVDLIESGDPELEHEVVALGPKTLPTLAERLDRAGAPFQCLGLSKWDPTGLRKICRALDGARADLVHTRLDYSNSIGVAVAASRGRARPRVVRAIDDDPGTKYAWPLRLGARYVTRWVDAEIAISESVRRVIERIFPRPPRPIDVIPPGLDLHRFEPSAVDLSRVRELRDGASRVIGTVGRLTDQKGLATLVHAMPRLRSSDRGTRLLVAGEGPRRLALERLASRLGVRDSVRFLGQRADMAEVYSAMDVFALPSQHEGFGIVFLEAMSMGIPVVGSRVVGIVDAIEDEVTGLVVPPADPAALASAILRLFDDPGLARSLADRARRRVHATRSREVMAARTEAVYRRTLENPS